MAVSIRESLLRTIEAALARGERVELIPVKEGVKAVRIKRNEIKEPHP